MRMKVILIAAGIILAAAGVWVASSPSVLINEGNQCGVGCRNVSTEFSLEGPGIFLVVFGIIIAAYWFLRKEEDA